MTQTVRRLLLGWYAQNARDLPWRRTADPYAVLVSEVMLQQTRVAAALPYYERFMARFPTAEALAAADEQEVLSLWQGLGYYNRARKLQQAAAQAAQLGGFPREASALRALPGFGPYTAGAVASLCFDARVPAVDGNVLRVIARLFAIDAPVDKPAGRRAVEAIAAELSDCDTPGQWNQAVMELGALVCTPRSPACGACPGSSLCLARAAGRAGELPALSPKRPPAEEEWLVAVLLAPGGVLMQRRPERGMLASMWQFPMLQGAAQAALAALGARDLRPLPDSVFRFTHRVWRMRGVIGAVDGAPEGYTAVDLAALAELPVPTALQAYREAAARALSGEV